RAHQRLEDEAGADDPPAVEARAGNQRDAAHLIRSPAARSRCESIDTEPSPEMRARIEAERQASEDVADRRDQREAVAGEAGGDQQAVDARDGAEHRQIVWGERLDARPTPRDRAR